MDARSCLASSDHRWVITMQSEQWRAIKDYFQRSLDLPPERRASFLSERCEDEHLRAEVLRLLNAHHESTSFLDSPLSDPEADVAEVDPLLGKQLGEFVLVRRIGKGGMGRVYEALQQQPRRAAAVKVLKPGFTNHDMLRRFTVEVEILGRLQHPCIAHAYAAGTFDSGDGERPWFAMELIQGLPLDEFLEVNKTSLKDRLHLFMQICDAVQHAHQRGVIHRDLKPANILIENGTRRPKILDFGIARATDPTMRLTLQVDANAAAGTLNYMSPEQMAGDVDTVDARSDVYALGVIGFLMLAGRLPHERSPILAYTVEHAGAAVLEAVPRRLGDVDSSLRGDLDCIFAMALDDRPSFRYQSAAELAADIRRHLNDELVVARPPTTMYQMQRFARRNRVLVGGVCATLLALVTGLILYASEAHRSQQEAQRSHYEAEKAVAINNFITNDFMMKLLGAANDRLNTPGQSGDATATHIPVAEIVDEAVANVDAMFGDLPLAEAAVRNEIGSIYYNLGAFERAAEQFRLALQRWETELSADHPDTLKAMNNLGQCMARLGRDQEAEDLYRHALEGRMRVLGEDDPFTLASMNNLANLFRWTGRLDESEALMRKAVEGQRRVLGHSHKHTLISMSNLGTLLTMRGELLEAAQLHRYAYETCCDALGPTHVTTLSVGKQYAETLHLSGALADAEHIISDVLASLETTVGPDHVDTIFARVTLARVYRDQGRAEECATQIRLALDAARPLPGRSVNLVRELEVEFADLFPTQKP